MAQQGNHNAIVRLGRRWLVNHPRNEARKDVLASMGMALVDLKRLDEALHALEEAERLGGLLSPEALVMYGDLLSQAQRHQQAVAVYRKSLAVNPTRDLAAWSQVQIARNLREAGQSEQARAILEHLSAGDQHLFRRAAIVLGQNLPRLSKKERVRS
jgi:tetratricopeptide (TPR) repeat protein